MCCRFCQSENRRSFGSEINIHFPGIDGINKRSVMVFPQLVVCLDCGLTEFDMPKKELRLLGLNGEERVDRHHAEDLTV